MKGSTVGDIETRGLLLQPRVPKKEDLACNRQQEAAVGEVGLSRGRLQPPPTASNVDASPKEVLLAAWTIVGKIESSEACLRPRFLSRRKKS